MSKNKLGIMIAVALLMVITFFVYQPALQGGYLFDDIHSLSKLTIIDDEVTAERVLEYVGNSDTGPLKRPISVLSFLLDGTNWPTAAYPFKRTNLLLHLLNGLVLYLLLATIMRRHPDWQQQAQWMAISAAAIWLLHPFLLSTTMYVVQRMAMLPALFTLLSMWLYVQGRLRYHDHNQGRVRLYLAVMLFVPLAVLSKENGVLLIYYLALLEAVLCVRWLALKPLPAIDRWLLIVLPGVLLTLLLIWQVPAFLAGYEIREFTVTERLLTQARALSVYLYHLLVPEYFTEGVFTDGFALSESLFKPITTLYAVVFLAALMAVTWWLRKRQVWLFFALSFFFLAHLLESTLVPLELYFEHRNYLASMFLFVPIVVWVFQAAKKYSLLYVLPLIAVAYVGFTTHLRANIWKNTFQMHHLTMDKYPESVRAAVNTAVFYENMRLDGDALALIDRALQQHDTLELHFNRISYRCKIKAVSAEDVDQLVTKIHALPLTKFDIKPLGSLMAKLITGDCLEDQALPTALLVLQAIEKNVNYHIAYFQHNILQLRGLVALAQDQFSVATGFFKQAFLVSDHDFLTLNNNIIKLITNQRLEEAEALQLLAEETHEKHFTFRYDWLGIGQKIHNTRQAIDQMRNAHEAVNHPTSQE